MAYDATQATATQIRRALLRWYDAQARALPWRVPPAASKAGARPDPYAVWLSEIMLQQTTVAAVIPYYEKFLAAWPTVQDLAAAEQEAVMEAWAGLGYYSRARNLHACARVVAEEMGGRFPDAEDALQALPGVGPYTAAAVAAIAFGARATVVDGNVERVTARLFAVEAPLPQAKPELRAHAASLTPKARPGDFAQAMMDLGATVCTPKSPNCSACPLSARCRAHETGRATDLPLRAPKKLKPVRYGAVFILLSANGEVFLIRRPPKGLLGGMLAPPSSDWTDGALTDPLARAPLAADWAAAPEAVRHTFTHFHLELNVYVARLTRAKALKLKGEWRDAEDLSGLPTVFRKAVRAALAIDF